MTALNAVSRTLYGKKRWKRNSNLFFARQDNMAPIGISELPKAILSAAVGFLLTDNNFVPVVLQGLLANQNWFVTQEGKWRGEYLPALYQCYPFRLIKAENGELVLCIDEESGLVTDDASAEGELFFDEENNPSTIITEIMGELNKVEQDTANARAICVVLQKHDLFEPWPIQLQGDVGSQKIEGLYRINEAKLNSLSAAALVELRDSSALLMIYGQLFSMQNVHKLGRLGSTYNTATKQPQTPDLGFGILEDSGSISFENL